MFLFYFNKFSKSLALIKGKRMNSCSDFHTQLYCFNKDSTPDSGIFNFLTHSFKQAFEPKIGSYALLRPFYLERLRH